MILELACKLVHTHQKAVKGRAGSVGASASMEYRFLSRYTIKVNVAQTARWTSVQVVVFTCSQTRFFFSSLEDRYFPCQVRSVNSQRLHPKIAPRTWRKMAISSRLVHQTFLTRLYNCTSSFGLPSYLCLPDPQHQRKLYINQVQWDTEFKYPSSQTQPSKILVLLPEPWNFRLMVAPLYILLPSHSLQKGETQGLAEDLRNSWLKTM